MPLEYNPQDNIPLPPKDANVHTTGCDYCIVGCGYKVFTWPVGTEGGPQPEENALGASFPGVAVGPWISPNQHNIVKVDGEDHHVVVVPDFETQVVNRNGNHSIRGGTLALKCYNPDTPTRDRLLFPQIRINGELTRVDWDMALEVMAAVSKHVIKNHGESAWAMKTFSYEFFENTYAITKLAFGAIKTPAFSQHDKPAMGADTGGLDDSGLINFNSSYDDWQEAEVIFVSGTDPFETKTVVFTEFMMKGPKLIMALPRRSTGVAFAEANGGLFLQVIPGTDTLLHLAISRIILENDWQDQEFIDKWVASSWEIGAGMGRGTRNTPWQWRTTWGQFGTDFAGYKDWVLNNEWAELSRASEITSVPAEKIRQAAEMLTGTGGERPKASFGFEKGNYWSNNYLNTASYAAMGLLCGAGNRPGRRIARLGGHQRGWMKAAGYPRGDSPEKLPGRRKIEIDLDRWVEAGNVRFAWVIGTTWTAAMAASQELAQRFRDMTVANPHQITSDAQQDIIDTLMERVDSGGMVVVDSDIYPIEPMGTEFADIVLPAAAWGEHDSSRCNGERRIRLYSKFYDAPGEAQPDWWAISRFAENHRLESQARRQKRP
jgi:arsenite oxidase large subunit